MDGIEVSKRCFNLRGALRSWKPSEVSSLRSKTCLFDRIAESGGVNLQPQLIVGSACEFECRGGKSPSRLHSQECGALGGYSGAEYLAYGCRRTDECA